jgi:hypothetical protein
MDAVDVLGIIEAALICATWAFVSRESSDFEGWRRKLEVSALVCPTVAVALDLIVTAGRHFHLPVSFEMDLWFSSAIGTILMCFCGLVFAVFGRGRFRIAAIV